MAIDLRHAIRIYFEDGRQAWIIIDRDELLIRGLRNIRQVEYQIIDREEQ